MKRLLLIGIIFGSLLFFKPLSARAVGACLSGEKTVGIANDAAGCDTLCAKANQQNCTFVEKRTGCCCIKGEECVLKDYYNINADCSPADFPNYQSYKPQFYFKPAQSNGTCAVEPLNYCVCQDSNTKQCDNAVSYNNQKHRLSCGSKNDPYSCDTYCAQTKNKSALFCDKDLAISDADKGCKFSLPPVNVSPYDFTGNIRSEAAGLNKLKGDISTPAQFIGNGIRVILLFIGSIALIMYIYGGLLWMTAAGNTERISKAKQILVFATLGVIAMLGSYLLVQFVFGTVLKLNV